MKMLFKSLSHQLQAATLLNMWSNSSYFLIEQRQKQNDLQGYPKKAADIQAKLLIQGRILYPHTSQWGSELCGSKILSNIWTRRVIHAQYWWNWYKVIVRLMQSLETY